MKSVRLGNTADACSSTDEARSPDDVARKVILIVEDEIAMSDLVSNVLAPEGRDTRSASNGFQELSNSIWFSPT